MRGTRTVARHPLRRRFGDRRTADQHDQLRLRRERRASDRSRSAHMGRDADRGDRGRRQGNRHAAGAGTGFGGFTTGPRQERPRHLPSAQDDGRRGVSSARWTQRRDADEASNARRSGPTLPCRRRAQAQRAAQLAWESNSCAGAADERGFPRALRLSRYRVAQSKWPVFHTGVMVQARSRRRA